MGKNKPNGYYDNHTLALGQILRPNAAPKPKPKRSLWKYGIALALLLSIGVNAYFLLKPHTPTSKPVVTERNQPASDEESASNTNDDGRLQREFDLRKAQDFRDSMLNAKRELVEKSANQKPRIKAPEYVELINKIVKNVESLSTDKGGDLNKKRKIISIILQDFDKLKRLLDKSKIEHKGIKEMYNRIQRNQDLLVQTQKDGASTLRAKKEIAQVVNFLKAIK